MNTDKTSNKKADIEVVEETKEAKASFEYVVIKPSKSKYKVISVKDGFVVVQDNHKDIKSIECRNGQYAFGDIIEI